MTFTEDFPWPSLTLGEFEADAKPEFFKVFNKPCYYCAPFSSEMTTRMIVYSEIHPKVELLDAIRMVATRLGEKGFFFSFVENYGPEIDYPGLSNDPRWLKTWFVPFDSIQDYFNLYFLTGHVMYSQKGTWGIYIDHYDFLVMGGIPDFMDEIVKLVPDLENQYNDFIEDWKNNQKFLSARVDWIPKLLEHVYGYEKANQIIEEHSLDINQRIVPSYSKRKILKAKFIKLKNMIKRKWLG